MATIDEPAPHTLRDYALLADGERSVLVGPHGDFAWMCFPRWESDAVFSSLLGGRGGYAVTPRTRFVWGGYYEPGTLVWRSRWVTIDNAVIECREALAMPSHVDRAVILRRIEAVRDVARVRVVLSPRASFGAAGLRELRRDDHGRWRGRTGELYVAWAGGEHATPRRGGRHGNSLQLVLDLAEGDHHDLVLVLALRREDAEPPDPEAAWSGTEAAWRERVPAFEETIAPHDARHAYAVLTGLTSSGGGMVAAATTSLPERARGGRNYDYRYAWIRDQCYAGRAVAKAGPFQVLDDAVGFVGARLLTDGPDLKPAYTTMGAAIPGEQAVDLPGYPGADTVIGNSVNGQFQLDPFGEALLLFAAAAGHGHLDAEGWRAVGVATDAIERRWREADSGIWELDPQEWTHSRLICAAGLRAISSCSPGGTDAARWLALADAITADTSARAVHPSGRWQRTPTDERVDAALLLPALRGAVPPDDPRSLATLEAVVHDLTNEGYAYRYRPDERPLGEAEGAFLLCGFILSLALEQQGETVEAARWFERNRSACGPPGLLSEEFDVRQRQLRGNAPQAFVHALLFECAAVLGTGRNGRYSSSSPSGSVLGRSSSSGG